MTKKNESMFQLEDKIERSTSKIDIIKDLIFGETMEAYDHEIEKLKKEVYKKKEALEDIIDGVRLDLNASIDSISSDVDIRITELEKNLENKIEDIGEATVNKKILGNLLIELGRKIGDK